MSWAPLEKLEFKTFLEDQFWKQKTWEGLKNENDPKVLREAIQLLLEIVVQKQSALKSVISFSIEQDKAHMTTSIAEADYSSFIKEMKGESTDDVCTVDAPSTASVTLGFDTPVENDQ
jgi:hypothetical protein